MAVCILEVLVFIKEIQLVLYGRSDPQQSSA